MADDLILEAVNEGVAAQRQVVAGGGAAGKGYAIHRAGIVDVYGVAALAARSVMFWVVAYWFSKVSI